jgi:iron complex transport system substrate-binding protein
MRIASLQPSISLTLAHLGALDALCAVTKYCLAAVPELGKRNLPVIHDSWTFGEADQRTLAQAQPQLVIASVPYRLESLAAILKNAVPVLALAPKTLSDVYHDILLIARQVDALSLAEKLVQGLQSAVADVHRKTERTRVQTVYCEEWGKPLIHSQPWVAELVEAANARFIGTPGAQTTAEAIAGEDPDVLLFAWCGAGDRVPLERLIEQRKWHDLTAVTAGRVFCIQDELLNTPSLNLHEGLLAIASALHPGRFPLHAGVRQLGLRTE